MDASTRLISLDGISLAIGHTQIVRHAKLSLERGERLGLLGANGSGKTTLLRVMATLLPPSAGNGQVLGAKLATGEVYEIRHRIVLIGHQPGLYADLTLAENLRLVARMSGRPESRAEEALDLVGLAGAADRRAANSSKGMLRRAELARVLVLEPDLLLMDEAHAGLDREAVGLVDALAQRISERGGGAVLVSHEADPLNVDRSIRLVDGMTEEAT